MSGIAGWRGSGGWVAGLWYVSYIPRKGYIKVL